jgi:hypothetical protein
MRLAFAQQPNETDKAFAGFSMYLSLGPERSPAKVGAKLGGKSQRTMEKWSSKFDWSAWWHLRAASRPPCTHAVRPLDRSRQPIPGPRPHGQHPGHTSRRSAQGLPESLCVLDGRSGY